MEEICTAKEICHWAWYRDGGNLHSKENLLLGMEQRWGKSAQQRKSVIGHGTEMEEICTAKEICCWAWNKDGGNLHSKGNLSLGMVQRWGKSAQQRKSVVGHGTKMEEICTAKEICHWAWYRDGGNLHSKGNLLLGMEQRWGKSAQQRKSVIGHGTKMEEICTAKEICHWAWYKDGGNLHSKGNLSLGMVQRWGKSAQQRKSVVGHGTKMGEICTAKEICHWAWNKDGGNLHSKGNLLDMEQRCRKSAQQRKSVIGHGTKM